MLRSYHIERVISPNDPRLEYVYESLLQPYFSPSEIEPIEKIRTLMENTASRTAKNPLVLMVAYSNHHNNPASLISGNILDFGKIGCGAIGYTVTREEHRKKGLASSLVKAFEGQIHKNYKHPKLVITEMRRGSSGFWDKVGYGKVQNEGRNVVYHQPPIDFNSTNGEPLYGKVRETLIVKSLNGNKDREDLRTWLMRGVEEVSREWYTPERSSFETEEAYQNALSHNEKVVQSNISSIRSSPKLKLYSHRN
jgi:hypothetical protein